MKEWFSLKVLLQSGRVNVNEGCGSFPTTYHMAAWRGQLQIVEQFLEYGADVNT